LKASGICVYEAIMTRIGQENKAMLHDISWRAETCIRLEKILDVLKYNSIEQDCTIKTYSYVFK
jgi:hypothetical protein